MLNGDTDRLPSRTDVLNEKSLILPVIQMGGRQSAQPSLHHQLPDRAVLEARNLERNVWEVEGVGRGMHLSCCKYCVPLLYWNNQEKWWERRSWGYCIKDNLLPESSEDRCRGDQLCLLENTGLQCTYLTLFGALKVTAVARVE